MRNTVIAALAVVAIGAVVFVLNKPEPTPAEKLSEAVQDVGEAAQDVVDEVTAVAEETVEAAQKQAEARADELREQAASTVEAVSTEVASISDDTRKELAAFLQEWRDSGIVTDEGIDFDAAVVAINASDLDTGTKSQLVEIVTFIQDLPGDVEANLRALEQSLR